MNKNQVIKDIARFHVEWVRYVLKNSLSIIQRQNAEDYVQDAYIKILRNSNFNSIKYYENDGKLNKKYFFLTLKSILINDYKKKKIFTVPIKSNIDRIEETDIKSNMEIVFNKIEKTIENLYWYDKKMLNLYVYHIPSIRKISTATTISSKSVFKTLKRCKLTIKKEVAKDYYYGKTG